MHADTAMTSTLTVTEQVQQDIERLAHQPGVHGCALVDAETGLVWVCAGGGGVADMPVWEAAVDYWRLHHRHADRFSPLGGLRAIAAHHKGGVLAVLPAFNDPDTLLVICAESGVINWVQWNQLARSVTKHMRQAVMRQCGPAQGP